MDKNSVEFIIKAIDLEIESLNTQLENTYNTKDNYNKIASIVDRYVYSSPTSLNYEDIKRLDRDALFDILLLTGMKEEEIFHVLTDYEKKVIISNEGYASSERVQDLIEYFNEIRTIIVNYCNEALDISQNRENHFGSKIKELNNVKEYLVDDSKWFSESSELDNTRCILNKYGILDSMENNIRFELFVSEKNNKINSKNAVDIDLKHEIYELINNNCAKDEKRIFIINEYFEQNKDHSIDSIRNASKQLADVYILDEDILYNEMLAYILKGLFNEYENAVVSNINTKEVILDSINTVKRSFKDIRFKYIKKAEYILKTSNSEIVNKANISVNKLLNTDEEELIKEGYSSDEINDSKKQLVVETIKKIMKSNTQSMDKYDCIVEAEKEYERLQSNKTL